MFAIDVSRLVRIRIRWFDSRVTPQSERLAAGAAPVRPHSPPLIRGDYLTASTAAIATLNKLEGFSFANSRLLGKGVRREKLSSHPPPHHRQTALFTTVFW